VDGRSKRSREVLRLKGVPDARLDRLWAGPGTSSPCEGCGEVINAEETEYDLDYRQADRRVVIRMHRQCYDDWGT
jgi:hypothetical protein